MKRQPASGLLTLLATFLMVSSPVTVLGQDRLTLDDGSTIQYFLALPDEADRNGGSGTSPLAVFMGGGSGNAPISYTVFRFYARELAALGWAVAVPISPDNRSFRGANGDRVRQLIAFLQQRDDISTGKTLLAGISAGGMSALELAGRFPGETLGVMAVPALARDGAYLENLSGLPIYLRIGSADELGWGAEFDATVATLEQAGAILDAELLYGQPHMFGLDWDRVATWLNSLEQ